MSEDPRMKDDFFRTGYEDYKNWYEYEDCPYDEGTDSEYGWRSGWMQARKEASD